MSVDEAGRRKARARWFIGGLGLVAVALALLSLTQGAVDVTLSDTLDVLARRIGPGEAPLGRADSVVWGIRTPRTLMGLLVGATLGAAGVAIQGMLRNRLADPHLLGIGPGAAIGAALGASAGGYEGAIAGGAVSGVVAAFIVRRVGRRMTMDPARLVLVGVALGTTLSAWVGFVVFGLDRAVVPPMEFWLLGSLAGATWRALGTVTFILVVALGVMFASRRLLDMLALGDREARQLGLDVDLVTTVLYIVIGAAVGASVGAVGVILFVGLLIPYLVRPLVGSGHGRLLPAAMLGGAGFLVGADVLSRLALEPVELPVGVVTSVLGGPLFVWLVSKGGARA